MKISLNIRKINCKNIVLFRIIQEKFVYLLFLFQIIHNIAFSAIEETAENNIHANFNDFTLSLKIDLRVLI